MGFYKKTGTLRGVILTILALAYLVVILISFMGLSGPGGFGVMERLGAFGKILIFLSLIILFFVYEKGGLIWHMAGLYPQPAGGIFGTGRNLFCPLAFDAECGHYPGNLAPPKIP